jgi:hypothetical protein
LANAAHLKRLFLLIDGENVSAKHAARILKKAAELGTLIEGRVYGAPDNANMVRWKGGGAAANLQAVDVPNVSDKKDIADFKLTVDAMTLLYTRQVDVMFIASGDGDFSALAEAIKSRGVELYGFGEAGRIQADYRKMFDDFFDSDEPAESKPARRATARSDKATRSGTTTSRGTSRPPSTSKKSEASAAAHQSTPTIRRMQTKSGANSRTEIPNHVVQAVLKIVRSHGGTATFRDIGNELPIEIPKFKAKTYEYASPKAMLKALHGKHGLEITKDGHVVLALV